MSEHDMDYELIKKAVKQALLEEGYALRDSEMEMGEKWAGGELIIKPQSDTLAEKRIPLEAFFHKIIMIRDRLRVLEQKINAHPKLEDEEKIDMQQYITRIYGSLTTFNLLFKRKSGWFVGEKGEKS